MRPHANLEIWKSFVSIFKVGALKLGDTVIEV
jgi:hypothetical protein